MFVFEHRILFKILNRYCYCYITAADDSGDAVKNGDDLRIKHPTTDDEATTTMSTSFPPSSTDKTTVGRSTERGRITLWGQPFWRRSAGVELPATSFKLLGMFAFFATAKY